MATEHTQEAPTNPFTPSEIASGPDEFFGRADELRDIRAAIEKGSIVIQGPVGIGKSSLLAQSRLDLEGFGSEKRAFSIIAVGDRDVTTVDEAARLILESLVSVDETQKKVSFKIGNLFEWGSTEIIRNFTEGRHLATLKRLLETQTLKNVLRNNQLLIIAIDEADKCPAPIARLIRSVATHTQQQGIKNIRFLLAGVSPCYKAMLQEDEGVGRFVYRVVTLDPMQPDEAGDLLHTKLTLFADDAESKSLDVQIDPRIISKVIALSGGHPHLLQLLGSHLVDHEIEDPDGVVDARDLMNSLRQIAFEDRAPIYESTLHRLQLENKLDALYALLDIAPAGFPTRISRAGALQVVDKNILHWLGDNSILKLTDENDYGLVDEFLRIRILLSEAESDAEISVLERRLVSESGAGEYTDDSLIYRLAEEAGFDTPPFERPEEDDEDDIDEFD